MRFLKWRRAPKPTFSAPLEPETPFFAVGDLHGCDALFERLLERLEELAHPTALLVCVGDYVDRGDQSAPLLERLRGMQQEASSGAMICLKGNHEEMLLAFLDDPAGAGPRWMRHGGLQTLASYRCQVPAESASPEEWEEARDRFREALGEETEAWLRGLPLLWQTGNVVVTHAGADPALPIGEQSEASLLWGHPDFETTPRTDGIWVVHGHTITDHPRPELGRIPTDTGAYATGRLTAALVEQGRVEFFHI